MPRKLFAGAVGTSLVVHAAILCAFALIQYSLSENVPLLLETVFSEERQQEEFSQDLALDTAVSENLTPVAGGVVTGVVGASANSLSATRIETSVSLKEPVLVANVREFSLPGESLLGIDLGESAVMGETGAVVEGYGPALSRLSRELLRMMRESKVLVVWMFDESESMKDDQRHIREQFHKVYEELGIAEKKAETQTSRRGRGDRPQDEVLLTSIVGFGEKVHYLLDAPSADINAIRGAISDVAVDDSGKENMCQAIRDVIAKYRVPAGRQERKLVVVLVTDESGDDGQFVEEAVQEAKRASAPIYILGREAVFGYPYAHQWWTDPKFGLSFPLRINRGPETAFPEALQWDGFNARDDAFQSGFGPYEQARLVKETGGVFFMLPADEENLGGIEAHDRRKFDLLDMKEYEPKLESRRDYEAIRQRSPFRTKIWDVIVRLNPHLDDQLSVRRWHYQVEGDRFRKEGQENFGKALRSMGLANQAAAVLEQIRPLREREESWRWRAAYDLVTAQVLAYRVRLFQYLLALDQHVKQMPKPKDPKNNIWNIRFVRELLPPDPEQVRITKIDMEELDAQKAKAQELYGFVIAEHPGTPWARRAQQELDWGFGVAFAEGYWDPRHLDPGVMSQITLPNL